MSMDGSSCRGDSVKPYGSHLTAGTLLVGCALALTPSVFTLGPLLETRYFPVTTRAEVFERETTDEGVLFDARFTKLRQCDYIGLSWYEGDFRLRVEFSPEGQTTTLAPGGQDIGPWQLRGVGSVEGTHAWVMHRCHPLWVTFTRFYGD